MQVLHQLDDPRLPELLDDDTFFWLDLKAPTADAIRAVGERLGLHRLAVEDTLERGQRPKLDDYGDTALLVFYGVDGDATPIEVHLHLSGSWMLTVHQEACAELDDAARRVEVEHPRTEEEAVYRVLDALTDSFFPVLETLDEEIDTLMGALIERPSRGQRAELFEVRRRLIELRRIVGPQRDVLARGGDLIARLPGLEADRARDWFRDVYDHLLHIAELIDSDRELLSGAMDVYLSSVSNRLSDLNAQLAIVATIFLPLTFVTGFFGQNFGALVRHIDSAWAFWVYGMGSMVVLTLALWAWFRHTGILRRE